MSRLHTLGRLQLVAPESPDQPLFTGPKPLMLLAYLAIEGPLTSRHLGELFFAGHADQLDNVSAAIRRLRHVDAGAIVSDGPEVVTNVQCDYLDVREAIRNASGQLAHELYRGSFLRGCDLSAFGTEFEGWAYEHRASLADSLRNCLLDQAEHLCLERRFAEAGQLAERAYLLPGADEPAPEVLTRLHGLFLVLHHHREAEVRNEALRFGVRSLSQTSEEVITHLAARLTFASRDNLPQPLSSFIGRDPELLELTAMLRNSDVRLVTLQGIGGTGKSQLALEVARQLTSDGTFPDGIHLVRLSAVPHHGLLPLVLASALDLSLQGTAPQIDQIAEFIGRKQLLLILDNFEHLMPAAEVTTTLLTRCPGLKFLVTSRERLGTQPEVPVTVDGLRYPDSDTDLEQALTYRRSQDVRAARTHA